MNRQPAVEVTSVSDDERNRWLADRVDPS